MTHALEVAAHMLLALWAPPFLLGVANKTKAAFAGRVGPPLFQAYHDLFKLARKGSVVSATTTRLFRAGPPVVVASLLLASQMIPFGDLGAPVSFEGDLLALLALFGLARFFLVAAALDTGSAFAGMGAAREVTFACLAEPALLLGLLVLAKRTAATSLGIILGAPGASMWHGAWAALVLVVASLFVVLLVESSRVPFDDPSTHLELTMVHEAMTLDQSGPALGLVLYGAAQKLFVLGAVLVDVAVPYRGAGLALGLLSFAAGLVAVAVVIGVVESTMARLRLSQVPSLLVGACLLSAFAIVLA